MGDDKKSMFLTDKQVEILRMKKKGMSQIEIARELKTTRGNICIIQKTALKNIEKAKQTIKFYRAMEAPVWVTIPAGMDLYGIPEKVFKAADRKHIKTSVDGAMIIVMVKTEVPDRVRGRVTLDDIDISVDEHGKVLVN